jgi:choline monooxygenase
MFVHQARLPHVLSPSCYGSAEQYARELDAIFRPGWHLVAGADDLATEGDFLTLELLGRPVQVRRSQNEWHAFSNVCAHRHCLLTGAAGGNSPTIRCQYHGWEYDCDGRTAGIPQPKNFVPFDRDVDRLKKFRLETCGQLLFVCFDPAAPSLAERLADGYQTLRELVSGHWRQAAAWSTDLDCNWKIPVENSLEGYHIPCVHPQTFKEAPTAERTTHVLGPRSTMYRTPNIAPSKTESLLFAIEGLLMRALGRPRSETYTHHHLFPNLLISSTDMLTLCIAVTPLAPTRCRILVRLFSYQDERANWLVQRCCGSWARLNRVFSRMVLREDFAIYPAIQRGLMASQQRGCLGVIEERVYAFQRYVDEQCNRLPTA